MGSPRQLFGRAGGGNSAAFAASEAVAGSQLQTCGTGTGRAAGNPNQRRPQPEQQWGHRLRLRCSRCCGLETCRNQLFFPPGICILLYKTEGGSEIPRRIPFLGYLCMLLPVRGRKRQRENLPGASSPPAGAVSEAGLAPTPTAALPVTNWAGTGLNIPLGWIREAQHTSAAVQGAWDHPTVPSIAPAFSPVHPRPQCSSQDGAAAPFHTSIDQKFLCCAWKKKNLLESCPGTWFSRADSFTGRKTGCLKPGDIPQASERKSGWSQSQFDPSITSVQSRKRGAGSHGSKGWAAPSTQACCALQGAHVWARWAGAEREQGHRCLLSPSP